MMTLKEKINQDFKEAFKAKDATKISVLRLLNAAIKNKEVEKRTKLSKEGVVLEELGDQSQLTDEEVLAVVGTEIKRRKDSIEQFEKGERPKLAAQEKQELVVLSAYLPEQLSEDELCQMVVEAIKESDATSAQDLGKVMRVLMPRVKGKADGGLVSKIVKEELGE